jgi:hypothetical protein
MTSVEYARETASALCEEASDLMDFCGSPEEEAQVTITKEQIEAIQILIDVAGEYERCLS